MEEKEVKKTTKRRGRPKKQSEGLGDTIEKVTKATGIDKLVKFVAGEDCGCEERKEKLNKLFPYKKPKCLTEQEYIYLTDLFESNPRSLSVTQQRYVLDTYNRVFDLRREPTTCSSCWREIIQKLKTVHNTYDGGQEG